MTDSRVREALSSIVGMIDGCADAPKQPDSLIQMVKVEALAALSSEAQTDRDAVLEEAVAVCIHESCQANIRALKGKPSEPSEAGVIDTLASARAKPDSKSDDRSLLEIAIRDAFAAGCEAAQSRSLTTALDYASRHTPALIEAAASRQQPAAEAGPTKHEVAAWSFAAFDLWKNDAPSFELFDVFKAGFIAGLSRPQPSPLKAMRDERSGRSEGN